MDNQYCVIIPAYQPEEELIRYTAELLSAGVRVVVVDDGSGASYGAVFGQLGELPGCTVLRHADNQGKGAAIKTAVCWCLNGEQTAAGVVTADCDGQHSVKDVLRVIEAVAANPKALVLGCRSFGAEVPGRSAMGNRLISGGMKLLYGIELEDTQTGLRGIPKSLMGDLTELPGDRYEYELNMLLSMSSEGVPFIAVPIQTIYFNNNSGSHFRPLRDSLRIAAQLCAGIVRYGARRGQFSLNLEKTGEGAAQNSPAERREAAGVAGALEAETNVGPRDKMPRRIPRSARRTEWNPQFLKARKQEGFQ